MRHYRPSSSRPIRDATRQRIAHRPLWTLFLLVTCSTFGSVSLYSAQSAQSVYSPCDLLENPAKFDSQTIQVRGKISQNFEDFTFATEGCRKQMRGIWLAYGGDEPTPITSLVNDRERTPGSVLKVNGRPIPLERTPDLQLMKQRLAAQRLGATEGLIYHSAPLYDITATLTGVFFAAPDSTPQVERGYGHLSCCHLFAIEKVSDVDAQRNSIPAGGRFDCTTEKRQIGAAEAVRLAAEIRPCEPFQDCHGVTPPELVEVPGIYGENVDWSLGTYGSGMTEIPQGTVWRSDNLLESYSLDFKHQNSREKSGPIIGAEASRRVCKSLSPPYPRTTTIVCRSLSATFEDSTITAANFRDEPRVRGESWRCEPAPTATRTALADAARRLKLQLPDDLHFDNCGGRWADKESQSIWCSAEDQNGMLQFAICLKRYGFLRHGKSWDTVPWVLVGSDGTACSAVP